MKNIFKTKNETTQKIVTKKKTLKSKIVKSLLFASIAYAGVFMTTTHYIDTKVKSVVTQEQRAFLNDITSDRYIENIIENKIKENSYTNEMYENDYAFYLKFKDKVKSDFDDLFKNDEYIQNNFKEYKDNYQLFLNDLSKSTVSFDSAFLNYLRYEKTKGTLVNKNSVIINSQHNTSENIPKSFFVAKVLKNNVNTKDLRIKIIQEQNILTRERVKSTNTDLFIWQIHLIRNISNKHIVDNNIPSYQLYDYYNNRIQLKGYDVINDKRKIKSKEEIKKSIAFNDIKNETARKNVDILIDKFISGNMINKILPVKLENKNDPAVFNTFRFESVNLEPLKEMNKLYEIKNENSKSFSNFNYDLYVFLGSSLLEINYKIKTFKSEKELSNTLFEEYKNSGVWAKNITNDKSGVFLSGFNDPLKFNLGFDSAYYEETFWNYNGFFENYGKYNSSF